MGAVISRLIVSAVGELIRFITTLSLLHHQKKKKEKEKKAKKKKATAFLSLHCTTIASLLCKLL